MFLTAAYMVTTFGEEEMLQIAGDGPRDGRSFDQAKIDEAIGTAVSLVVGYVSPRYPDVTTASVPTPMLQGFAADIARYRLRGKGGQQSAMSDVVQKRYDDAVLRLKDIAAGRLALDLASNSGSASSGEFAVSASVPVARAPSILEGY